MIQSFRRVLQHPTYGFSSHGLFFLPPKEKKVTGIALLAHGYTSSKQDLISWAGRLLELDLAVAALDLPGHFLGSFHDLTDPHHFRLGAADIFHLAYLELTSLLNIQSPLPLISIGHSLGGFLALRAHSRPEHPACTPLSMTHLNHPKLVIAVGLGNQAPGTTHLFDSQFYQKTLQLRSTLVSEHLAPGLLLPWIREEKTIMHQWLCPQQPVILLTGQDDAVVGDKGAQRLLEQLSQHRVELLEPSSLAHHRPELAASHLFRAVKQFLSNEGVPDDIN
jgi:alpha-beta hydrolase superfamily lysophospholipase